MNIKKFVKKNLSLICIIDCVIIITLIYIYKSVYVLSFIIVLHALLVVIMLKKFFNINIINISKFYNYFNNKLMVKKLEEGEEYLKTVNIDTFDGSGGLTHPSILYFKNKFNGYKYWMVYTPYDNNNVELENPCIAVSNNGIEFDVPKGLKNPLLPIIKRRTPNTYYNDPFLLYNKDRLEIWYRYTVEKDTITNDIYRIISSDGINWTRPELIIPDDGKCYMSMSIVKIEDFYYMFYFNLDYKFKYKRSRDLITWENEKDINVNGFSGKYWHGEVKLYNNKLFLIFMDKEYNLYVAKTDCNKITSFDECKIIKLNYYSKSYLYTNTISYKSTYLMIDDYIYLYVPFRIEKLNLFKTRNVIHKKWELTVTKLKKENIKKILKEDNK